MLRGGGSRGSGAPGVLSGLPGPSPAQARMLTSPHISCCSSDSEPGWQPRADCGPDRLCDPPGFLPQTPRCSVTPGFPWLASVSG